MSLMTKVFDGSPAMTQAKLIFFGVSALVLLLAGGAAGWYLGSAVEFKAQQSKVTAAETALQTCKDAISKAEKDAIAKAKEGQETLNKGQSDVSEHSQDSADKRQQILNNARKQESQKQTNSGATKPATGTQGQPQTQAETPAIPRNVAQVINQLLEVSNETGFYDLSATAPAAGVRVVPDQASVAGDGGSEGSPASGDEGADSLLQASAEAGGPRLLEAGS